MIISTCSIFSICSPNIKNNISIILEMTQKKIFGRILIKIILKKTSKYIRFVFFQEIKIKIYDIHKINVLVSICYRFVI